MARITCTTPAAGKPLKLARQSAPASMTTIIDAPDFSIPDPSNTLPNRDPLDGTRAIVPGEVYITTPLMCRNRDTVTRWLAVRLIMEDGQIINLGQFVIPSGETVEVPLQGRSLTKFTPGSTWGDRLQVQAQVAAQLDWHLSAVERRASDHSGVTP